MEGIIIVVYLIIMVVNWYSNKLGYYQKFAVKSVLTWISIGFFAVGLMVAVASISMSYEEIMDHDVSYRLERVESNLVKGDFDYVKSILELYDCYEEEFDYAWEQVDMYELYNRYLIYTKAAKAETDSLMRERFAEKAQQMKSDLIKLCKESTFEKNKLYAEYYGELVWE